MASVEFKYTRIRWRLKGTHAVSFGKKAKWFANGRGVDSSRYAFLSDRCLDFDMFLS